MMSLPQPRRKLTLNINDGTWNRWLQETPTKDHTFNRRKHHQITSSFKQKHTTPPYSQQYHHSHSQHDPVPLPTGISMSLAIRTLHDTRDRWYIPRKPLTARPPRQELMRKTPVKNEIVKLLSRGIPLTTVPLTPCQSTVTCGNGCTHLMVPHERADPLRPGGGVRTVAFILRRYRVPGPLRPPVTISM